MFDFAESEWLLALVLFGGLLTTLEMGYRAGRRRRHRAGESAAYLTTIQASVLGLLGLLLGFSFAAAQTRLVARQDLLVDEANAIGTAYLRAELLEEPHRGQLRAALREYTAWRLDGSGEQDAKRQQQLQQEAASWHERIWQPALQGVKQSPQFNVAVLEAVNRVIDSHEQRLSAASRHLPSLVLITLLVCALVGMASVGFGCGVSGSRNTVLTAALGFLIAATLWVTIDLDYPERGLIRIDQRPLQDVLAGELPQPAATPLKTGC